MNKPTTCREGHQVSAVACPSCDLVFDANLADGETACCSRCGHFLTRYRSDELNRVMAFTLSAIVLLALSNLDRFQCWRRISYFSDDNS